MKKFITLLLTYLIVFSSCSNDDKNRTPDLRKLTKVTCYRNDDNTPLYDVDIFYKADGSIAHMQTLDKGNLQFFYVGNSITVSGSGSDKTEYTLSKNLITQKKTYTENQYASNSVYVNEESKYSYSGNRLISSNLLIRWPNEDGKNYESREFQEYNKYQWTNGGISRFTRETQEMVFEYTSIIRPYNFPLLITNTFTPTSFDIVSPVNFLMGYLFTYLPNRIYWYNIPETTNIRAEYTFTYATSQEENSKYTYLSSMDIHEKIYNEEEKSNLYKLYFEYEF